MKRTYMIVTDFHTSMRGNRLADALYHRFLMEKMEVYRIVLEENEDQQICMETLYEIQPEVIITFDMAGFELKKENGEIFYNSLYAENHHILTKESYEYLDYLYQRMSYPTTLYPITSADGNYIRNYYPNIFRVDLAKDNLKTGKTTRTYQRSEKIKEQLEQLPQVWKGIAEQSLKEWGKHENEPYYKVVEKVLFDNKVSYSESEFVEVMGILSPVEYLEKMKNFEKEHMKTGEQNSMEKLWEEENNQVDEEEVDFFYQKLLME